MSSETFKYRFTYNHGAVGGVVLSALASVVLYFCGLTVASGVFGLIAVVVLGSLVYRNLSEKQEFSRLVSEYQLEQHVQARREELYIHARREDDPISPGIVDCHEIVDIEKQLEHEFPGYDSPLIDHEGSIYFDDDDNVTLDNVTEEKAREQLNKRLQSVK